MTSVQPRPSLSTVGESHSSYSQSMATYHSKGSSSPASTPPESVPMERSFNIKRASSYRVPVPPYDRPEAPTPTRATRSASVTEFPPLAEPSKALVIFRLIRDFVLCRNAA